ncbi:uncharacterized protein [Dysidea avara]|uniref:uncharacterized protein n=1 Tax=Dysidea avara TaxID=196820 RepID=UPI0033219882
MVAAISREDLDVKALGKYRVCSCHFLSGKPAALKDDTDIDWLPTINLGHSKRATRDSAEQAVMRVMRHERARRRRDMQRAKQQQDIELSHQLDIFVANEIDDAIKEEVESIIDEFTVAEDATHAVAEQLLEEAVVSVSSEVGREQIELAILESAAGKCNCADTVKVLKEELAACYTKINKLSNEIAVLQQHVCSAVPFNEQSLVDDACVQFYTGLPNLYIVKTVLDHVHKTMAGERATKLSSFQEFMCVLLKLRLNSPLQDLAYRFQVSLSTVSRILSKWLVQMDIRLQKLIVWPDRDSLRKTMPKCFQTAFGKSVAIIIDCFEVFIERPSNLEARAVTWSNYKHKNTAKILLGIVPQGVVAFVSDAWGGRVSDKYLTEHCGLLSKLLPGDIVLADRGFDIAESVGVMQARLHIPAFTKGKDQLSALEVEQTRSIANVRIHVERVIGLVRQKYSILQSTIPIHFVKCRHGEDIPLIDRIVRVSCALTNICNSVVPLD